MNLEHFIYCFELSLLFICVTSKCDTNITCPFDEFLNICEYSKEFIEICANIQCDILNQRLVCPLTCKLCNSRGQRLSKMAPLSASMAKLVEKVISSFKTLIRNVCLLVLEVTICENLFSDYIPATTTTTTASSSFQG